MNNEILSDPLDNTGELLKFYKEHLMYQILPFWMKAIDTKRGGLYTCFNNMGTQLVSRDKYTWSQGRFVWIWSRLADLCKRGIISGTGEDYIHEARKTAEFLWEHALLSNGNCAFYLSEEGLPKEEIPGHGYDTSFYADCFVILGFTELFKVTKETIMLHRALKLYDTLIQRVKRGHLQSDPYPIPEGLNAHAVSMILLNVTEELHGALHIANLTREIELRDACHSHAIRILEHFRLSDGRVQEMTTSTDIGGSSVPQDTVLMRHLNPGHTIEDMWFLIHAAFQQGHKEWIEPALASVKRALDMGWDKEYGGLLRFVDRDGGPPQGNRFGGPYEKLILDTWDTKLWWPHSEALYTSMLAWRITGNKRWRDWYRRIHTYVFQTFPNPNAEAGEWIQIRNRIGEPVEKLVALPVKDPYHIIRNLLLIIDLLSNPQQFRGEEP